MKNLIPFALIIGLLMTACSWLDPKQKEADALLEKEKAFMQPSDKEPNKQEGFVLIKSFMDFAEKYPGDSLSAKFLFSGGKLAMNINDGNLAIRNFNQLLTDYPENPNAPEALFLMAYVYDNQFQDLERAKKHYEEFIQKYPGHDFADDAASLMKNLGKSPEEMIREFETANALSAQARQP